MIGPESPCDELPAAIALDKDLARDVLESRLDVVGRDNSGWVLDTPCRDCGQRWWVDRPDQGRRGFAIKAPEVGPYDGKVVRLALLDYLRRIHGGEGELRCLWRDCDRRALNGSAHCAEHAYDIMGARG